MLGRRPAAAYMVLAAALSACSGRGTAGLPAAVRPVTSAAPAAPARYGSLAFSVTVPARSTVAHLRRAEAVSASTRSFAFAVDGTTVATQNVGIGQAGCTTDVAHPAVYQFQYPAGAEARGITLDATGNVWFVEDSGSALARINGDDTITQFVIPGSRTSNDLTLAADGTFFVSYLYGVGIGHFNPTSTTWLSDVNNGNDQSANMALGSDGSLYYSVFSTSNVSRVDRIDGNGGSFIQFPTTAGVDSVTRGADGNIWASEATSVARVTTAGAVTEFPIAGAVNLRAITSGTDGYIYAADFATGTIYRIATAGGSVAGSWTIPAQSGLTPPANPLRLVAGPDGAIYASVYSDAATLGFVTRLDPTSGTWTVIPISGTSGTTLFAGHRTRAAGVGPQPWGLVFDPRGVLYVTECNGSPGNKIAQITFPQRCTTTVARVPAGTHTIAATAYDGLAGAGNALGAAALPGTTIVADQNNIVPLTLSPVVSTAAVVSSSNTIGCGGSGTNIISINAKDATGATLIGSYLAAGGSPLTFTLSNSDVSGVTTLAGSTIGASTTTLSLNFSGAITSSTATISAVGGGVTATPKTLTSAC